MRNKHWFILLMVLLHPVYSGASFADDNDSGGDDDCAIELVEVPKQIIINYDPFLPGITVVPLRFSLEGGDDDCRFSLAVSLQNALPTSRYQFADTGVEIELRTGNDQAGLRKTKTDGVFSLRVDDGDDEDQQAHEYTLDLVVIEDAVAAAEDHIVSLDFKLSEGANIDAPINTWRTDLVLRSLPRAQINLSGTTGGFGDVGSLSSVDFGIAKEGAQRLIYLQLRANTASTLTVVSENRGVLKHKAEKGAPTIAYQAELGDEPVDLSKPYEREFDLPKTYAGESHPFTLTLGDPSSAMAGKYSDIIVFEFSPL